jgi:hypothetical protein
MLGRTVRPDSHMERSTARLAALSVTTVIPRTKNWLYLPLFLFLLCAHAVAQSAEVLPEGDVYLKLSSVLRTSFQVKATREGGEPTQAEIGPSMDFYLSPWTRFGKGTLFDVDDSKLHPFVFSIGYRYLPQANKAPATNRMENVLTFNLSTKNSFLLSDRNRADLDWKSGGFTWRYRNRFQVEKNLTIGSYHPAPYVSTEFFYESQYSKWSNTTIDAGFIFTFGKHVEFDPYYEHQNNTGKSPNQQVNALGLILNLYFAVR